MNDFLNTIGICVHAGSNITPNLNAPLVLSNIQYIGACKYRDDLSAIQSWQLAVLQALAKAGVQLIANPPNSGNLTTSYSLVINDLLTAAKSWNNLAPIALFALGGPNEPVNFPIACNGFTGGGSAGSFLPVANFQLDWYAAVKADPVLKNIPVWSVTATGAEKDNVVNYDLNTQKSIIIPPVRVTVSLGAGRANMNVFDITAGTQSTSTSNNATGITVSLTDYPLIIDILPVTTSSF